MSEYSIEEDVKDLGTNLRLIKKDKLKKKKI